MKTRLILSGFVAAAVIALSGCDKVESVSNVPEEFSVSEAVPFTLGVGIDTRTTNDGVKTNWVKNDQINVFHAVAGTNAYVSDSLFKADDAGATVDFSGTSKETLNASGNYDWYAIYPYNKNIVTPASTSAGYLTVGSAANGTKTQNGLNSTAHISGKNYPIGGVASNVAATEKPQIVMKHLSTLMEVVVTNGLPSSSITVTGVSLTAQEDIVGTYYINFVDPDYPIFTGSGTTYVSTTASLAVNSSTAIGPGESAKFYLAVKPFSAESGKDLTISITTAEFGQQNITKQPTSDLDFEAGKKNTLNATYTKSGVSDVYHPISGPDDLTVGSKVIFVAENYDIAMAAQNGNYRNQVAVAKGTDVINDPDGVAVFTVGSGANNNYYSFFDGTGYLNAPGGGNNLTTVSAIDDKSSWMITYEPTGSMSGIKSTNPDATQVVLSYNKNNTRFSCYADVLTDASVRGDVVIYKLDGSGDDTKVVTFLDVPNTLDVNLGSTPTLDVATNSSATVTYSSGTPSVATIGSDGKITPVAAGTATITVSVPASGKYAAVTKTCEITVKSAESWTKKAITAIKSTDVFVIVGEKADGKSFILPNNNGTTSAPSAVVASISGDKLSGSVHDEWKWNLGGNSAGYIFYPDGSTTTWLYATNTNNGVRVGTATSNKFTYTTEGYLRSTSYTTRDLCVYNTQDWRTYTTSGSTYAQNVVTVTFYVKD